MGQQDSLVRRGSGLTRVNSEISTTSTNAIELFKSCESLEEREDAAIKAVHRLAKIIHATESGDEMVLLAECVGDMPARALALAFTHLERHWLPTDSDGNMIHILPTPAEIRAVGSRLLREERVREESLGHKAERDELERRRQEHPEEFGRWADIPKLHEILGGTIPGDKRTSPIQDAQDVEKRRRELEAQKAQAMGGEQA
jgi:hypothetical protein